jgi:hypothetical protein
VNRYFAGSKLPFLLVRNILTDDDPHGGPCFPQRTMKVGSGVAIPISCKIPAVVLANLPAWKWKLSGGRRPSIFFIWADLFNPNDPVKLIQLKRQVRYQLIPSYHSWSTHAAGRTEAANHTYKIVNTYYITILCLYIYTYVYVAYRYHTYQTRQGKQSDRQTCITSLLM